MCDPAIYASAISTMDSEIERGTPVKNRMTLELAVARAEETAQFESGRVLLPRSAPCLANTYAN